MSLAWAYLRPLIVSLPAIVVNALESNPYKIIYFDIETSSFSKNADILQIASKSENSQL